jgi:4-oxalocrotonate tautomerase
MPVITIDTPALNKEQKRELVNSFAKSASKIIGLPVSAMVIIIMRLNPRMWEWETPFYVTVNSQNKI